MLWKQPRIPFKARLGNQDIFQLPTTPSGISYDFLLELIFAAVWAQHTPIDFFEQDTSYQAMVVQAYRTEGQIEAVLTERAKRKAKG